MESGVAPSNARYRSPLSTTLFEGTETNIEDLFKPPQFGAPEVTHVVETLIECRESRRHALTPASSRAASAKTQNGRAGIQALLHTADDLNKRNGTIWHSGQQATLPLDVRVDRHNDKRDIAGACSLLPDAVVPHRDEVRREQIWREQHNAYAGARQPLVDLRCHMSPVLM